jgi:hypothetical protein
VVHALTAAAASYRRSLPAAAAAAGHLCAGISSAVVLFHRVYSVYCQAGAGQAVTVMCRQGAGGGGLVRALGAARAQVYRRLTRQVVKCACSWRVVWLTVDCRIGRWYFSWNCCH